MRSPIWILIIFIIFLFGNVEKVKGQINSTQGWFVVDFNQGCAPLTVNVSTTISDVNVPIFQFEGIDDPNEFPWSDNLTSITYTYSTPGSYMIYLTIQTGSANNQDSLLITVLQSQIPEFELRSCQSNGLVVEITDTFYDSFIVDFGDGNSTTVLAGGPDPNHFYADTQTYIVTVTGRLVNAPTNCLSDSRPFSPSAQIVPPTINTMLVQDNNDIDLTFTFPQNLSYRLEAAVANAQNFQFFQTLTQNDTNLSISGFSPDVQQYCFRISAIDPCFGNVLYSNINCSLSTDLNIINNENLLSWQTVEQGNGEENYQVSRNTIPNFITFPSGTFNFDDKQVNCNVDYCYTVTNLYDNGSQSISTSICGTSFSTDTPPSIENMSVDIVSDGVVLFWDNYPDIDESFIRQLTSGNTVLSVDTTSTNPAFLSTDLDEYPQTCYQHTYLDVCGNMSETNSRFCSILLSGTSNPDGSITLSWSDYEGWVGGVQNYILEKYTKDGVLFESIDLGTQTTYQDDIDGTLDQILTYIILANPVDTTFPSIHSNVRETARRAQLYYPDAFTPNGDGLNDVFKPEFLFIKYYDLKIYSRWGELVFSSDDPKVGWDGLIRGEAADQDSYTFLTQSEDFRGLKISRSGIVLLLRN